MSDPTPTARNKEGAFIRTPATIFSVVQLTFCLLQTEVNEFVFFFIRFFS